MNEPVTIAAVLCNYNGGDYLKEAIDSVLEQEYLPSEFIVVDDKSTDNSLDIINAAQQIHPELITLIQHDQNKGQAAGMNSAFTASNSDLIAFLDSDDIWFPGKLAALRDAYEGNPNFGLYQHNLQIIMDADVTDEMFMPAMMQGDVFEYWHRYSNFPNFSPTSGLAIRREVFTKLAPLPESLRISSDSFMTRSAICFGPLVSTMTPLGGYRRHSCNNVYGNTKHDSWKFFLNNVSPLLADFYQSHEFTLPDFVRGGNNRRTTLDTFLDINLRAIMNKMRILLRISKY
jgi:glycosyltransferase involved in cell wall biosynthesis